MGRLIFITVCYLFGVLSLHHLSVLPPNSFLIIYLFSALVMLIFRRRWSLYICSLVIGFGWAHLQANFLLEQQLPEQYAGTDISVTGYVASIPGMDARKIRFEFDIESFDHPVILTKPGRVLLSWYRPDNQEIHVGDRLSLTVRLKLPRNFSNPASFNYSGWLLQKRILHTGYVRDQFPVVIKSNNCILYAVNCLRAHIQQRLNALKIQPHASAFIRALTIGERSGLTQNDWDTLQKTGTTHLMAISGLHIGLIAGIIYYISVFIWSRLPGLCIRLPASQAAVFPAWFAAFSYAMLAGFTIPTQRALIMLSIVFVFVFLRKQHRPTVVLSISMLAILIIDSFAVLSASFWLSFFAVSLIYYLIYIANTASSKIYRWLHLQFVISLGLIPLTIMFFQQASIISPLANMIAVPVAGLVIVPLCFVSSFVLIFSDSLARWLFEACAYIFELLWQFLEWLAELDLASLYFPSPTFIVLAISILGFILLLLPRHFSTRITGLVCIIPLFFSAKTSLEHSEVQLTVLDVGQGLATVVKTRNHVLIFDAGPAYSKTFDTGKAVVIPYLKSIGIKNIDMMMVSHGDNDHIGGVESIYKQFSVNNVLTSVPAKLQGYQPVYCQRGQSWNWDDVQFEVLHPDKRDYHSALKENDLSCVLRISTANKSMLLTGDIEAEAESLVLSRYEDLKSHVLVVPHHGSKTSSSSEFVNRVSPGVAIISAGWKNRYGFPHESVSRQLSLAGSKILSTATSGAIRYDSMSGQITRYRPEHRYYWERH